MPIVSEILRPLQALFPASPRGQDRGRWFVATLAAMVLPLASARTSNVLRALQTVFDLAVSRRRFYAFIASPRLPWARIWSCVWRAIPNPITDGRLVLVLDDFLNPKTGRRIFGCDRFHDHAAKPNQSRYPWAQNVVALGLLRRVKGRWAWVPLAVRFYLRRESSSAAPGAPPRATGPFRTKLALAVEMLAEVARVLSDVPVLIVTDSWFGNHGLLGPARRAVGPKVHILSRLRSNAALFDVAPPRSGLPGRPRTYGARLGTAAQLATDAKERGRIVAIDLYGRVRAVVAHERVVTTKALRCPIRVVWTVRGTQWVALFTTDLALTLEQIVEYYGSRWKIEAGFKELKQEIGSSRSQSRRPHAVSNHLNFCLLAMTLTWIHADQTHEAIQRRHAVKGRRHYAFSDARRALARVMLDRNTLHVLDLPRNPARNVVFETLMRLVA
jgi:hypothetical protein